MPLMHKKSKAAFEHNIKAEIESGKPQKQALAIAYSVKRKPKKMAGGGIAESVNKEFSSKEDWDPNNNARTGAPQKALGSMPDKPKDDDATRLRQYQAADASGNRSQFTPEMESDYQSLQGAQAKYDGGMINEDENSRHQIARNGAKKALTGDDWTDNPVIPKPRTQAIKKPRMVPSDAFSTRLYDQEGHLMEDEAPASPKEQPEEDYNEKDAKRQGPSTSSLKMKKMAKGGSVEDDSDHQAKNA